MGALLECPTSCLKPLTPVQTPYPIVQTRVVSSNHFDIALEQGIVRGIEPDDRGIQENISLGHVATKQVWMMFWARKVMFESVQRLEEFGNVLVIGGL